VTVRELAEAPCAPCSPRLPVAAHGREHAAHTSRWRGHCGARATLCSQSYGTDPHPHAHIPRYQSQPHASPGVGLVGTRSCHDPQATNPRGEEGGGLICGRPGRTAPCSLSKPAGPAADPLACREAPEPVAALPRRQRVLSSLPCARSMTTSAPTPFAPRRQVSRPRRQQPPDPWWFYCGFRG